MSTDANCEVRLTIKNRILAQCSIAFSAASDRQNCNGREMVLFAAPSTPKERVFPGKDSAWKNKKNSIKTCQNEAWMSAINYGCANGCAELSENKIFRTCMHHFHLSVIMCDSSDRCQLKIGTAPTMWLS